MFNEEKILLKKYQIFKRKMVSNMCMYKNALILNLFFEKPVYIIFHLKYFYNFGSQESQFLDPYLLVRSMAVIHFLYFVHNIETIPLSISCWLQLFPPLAVRSPIKTSITWISGTIQYILVYEGI